MASAADLPVDLVEEIFLRLDHTAGLIRASAACVSFRRVVSDSGFLRRFRSLHHGPVLGLLSRHSSSTAKGFRFYPAEPPRRSAQAARAAARAAGFSSSFLPAYPTEHYWHVHDARDGRGVVSPGDATLSSFLYLVVYDPLHCKHVQIPPVPKDIMAWHGHYCRCCDCECQFDPFLVPAGNDEKDDKDDLSFRVMCTVLSTDSTVLESFIYSSVTGKWCGVASLSNADYEPLYDLSFMKRHYAHGCFYWVDSYDKDMLVLELDMNKMKFSVVRVPPSPKYEDMIVMEAAEEDRIGLLVLDKNTLHLHSKTFGSANDCWPWRHDAEVTLLDSYQWLFGGAADQGYALLQGVPRDEFDSWMYSDPEMGRKTNAHYFTVEVQTLTVEQLCVAEFDTEPVFLYAKLSAAVCTAKYMKYCMRQTFLPAVAVGRK